MYYIIDVEYSQTDKTTVIIRAKSEREAEIIALRQYPNGRCYNHIRKAEKIITGTSTERI